MKSPKTVYLLFTKLVQPSDGRVAAWIFFFLNVFMDQGWTSSRKHIKETKLLSTIIPWSRIGYDMIDSQWGTYMLQWTG